MTHIGYEKDIELAQKTRGVHLIVGGHSHSLLGPYKDAEGPYPTITRNLDGEEVFVVTSHRWGEHLGYIDVAYDPQGRIVAYTGGPIHLTNETAQDKDLQKQIKEWRAPFEEYANQVVGYSEVVLGMHYIVSIHASHLSVFAVPDQAHCKQAECLLGDYMADALADYRPSADGAIINGGGVRATIDKGNITRGEIITAFPFRNAAVEVKFNGSTLWKSFEGIVSKRSLFNGKEVGRDCSEIAPRGDNPCAYHDMFTGCSNHATLKGDSGVVQPSPTAWVTYDFTDHWWPPGRCGARIHTCDQ
jgi:2',3'-cyclic-nucleotide 2'-phosphodiesterase (5'-nucleotidase family)